MVKILSSLKHLCLGVSLKEDHDLVTLYGFHYIIVNLGLDILPVQMIIYLSIIV